MLFKSNRRNRRTVQTAVESTVKSSIIEPLEGRVLMAANAWKAAVSGSWDVAANWSLGHVPTSTEDVTIAKAGTYTVTHSSTATDSAHSVTVSAGTLLLTGGTISTPTMKITAGTLTFKGGTLSGGTLSTSGTGKITTTSTASIIATETIASNIVMASGSVLDLHHTITFSNSAIITVPSATLNLQDMTSGGVALAGTGKITLSGTGLVSANKVSHAVSIGSGITIDGTGTATFAGGTNSGSISADISGKTLAITGTLTNKGTVKATAGAMLNIKNPSTFTNTGTLGANTGTILVSGAFKLGTGTLNVGLSGTTAGSTYGVLNVQGALTLGGTLNVFLNSPFSPANGVAFTPIKYTSKTGSFATTKLPAAGNLSFTAAYGATALTLTSKITTPPTGPVVTFSYTQVQIAKDVNFTTGVQTLTILNNTVNVPVGDYFRFGVSVIVTGNKNPASGGLYDQAHGITQPVNLGLADFGFSITDSKNSVLSPAMSDGNSLAAFDDTLWSITAGGVVDTNGTIGGNGETLFAGLIPNVKINGANATTFSEATIGAAGSQTLFSNVVYKAAAAGTTLLNTAAAAGQVAFVVDNTLGTAKGAPSYTVRVAGVNDTINNPAPLTVKVA